MFENIKNLCQFIIIVYGYLFHDLSYIRPVGKWKGDLLSKNFVENKFLNTKKASN